MKVNKKQAAEMVGIGRTTFYKHIKSKPISVDSSGKIDVSELIRVYGSENVRTPEQIEKNKNEQDGTQKSVHLNEEITQLKSQIQNVEKERNREREQLGEEIETLRRNLDKAMSQNDNLTRLLTDQRSDTEKSQTEKEEEQSKKLDAVLEKIEKIEKESQEKKSWWPFGGKK